MKKNQSSENINPQVNNALSFLLENHSLFQQVEDEKKLLKEICQKVAGFNNHQFCWIILFAGKDGTTGEMTDQIFQFGIDTREFEKFKVASHSPVKNIEKSVESFRKGINYIYWEITGQKTDRKLSQLAKKFHFNCFLQLPIRQDKDLTGILTVHSGETAAFKEVEVKLFQYIAANLAFVLNTLRTRENLKHTRQDLLESREMLQLVMDTIPVRLFWKDREFHYLGCNKAFANDAGLNSPDEIIGKNDFELSWKETAPLYRSDDREIIEKNISKINYEEPQVREDGTRLWLRTSKIPLRDSQGQVIGLFGSYEDITERKNAEEALWESERRYKMATTAGRVGVWDWNINNDFLFIDPILKALLGFDDNEIANNVEGWRSHIYPDDVGNLQQSVEEYLSGKISHLDLIYRMVHRDGDIKWFEARGTLLKDKEGKPYRMVGTNTDITRQKELEIEQENIRAQLLQAQKMEAIGTLAGGMAHDFNNLLTSIKGYTDLSLMNIQNGKMLDRNLNQIQKAVKRAGNLTNQLLLFSRKQMIAPASLNINETIRNMLMMLDRVIGEDIRIDTRLGKDIWKIWADEGNIEQLIMNLALNSRDAMPEGGRILIETDNLILEDSDTAKVPKSRPGKFVVLKFCDTGLGMSEEILNHIFEPFFTTKEVGKGTGLGLSVIYGIISQHEGWINVSSKPGEGTTFEIYFPATFTDSARETAEKLSLQDFRGRGESILLVEDESDIREFIAHVLSDNGYTVSAAASYQEALLLFGNKKKQFQLIFSDVVLPDRNGLDLVEEFLKKEPDLAVILSSGYAGEKSNWERIQARGFRFLRKPFSMDELLHSVFLALKKE